jgi:hypothetical protein
MGRTNGQGDGRQIGSNNAVLAGWQGSTQEPQGMAPVALAPGDRTGKLVCPVVSELPPKRMRQLSREAIAPRVGLW